MRRLISLFFMLPIAVEPACFSPEAEEPEETNIATDRQQLLAGSKLLWPMKDGKATVKVCFLPLNPGGIKFPIAQYAQDVNASFVQYKQWIKEGVEQEWNAKTVMSFVGWNDCTATDDSDVKIQIGSSGSIAQCGKEAQQGSTCVEDLGNRSKGKHVYINALWIDEVLYEARYAQSITKAQYDPAKDIPYPVLRPVICGTQADNARTFGVSNAAIDAFKAVMKPCLQNISVHEFGHLSGFSHEQNRLDVSPACAAQYAAYHSDTPTDEDTPLGPFEADSIMSYCRTTLPPTLTKEDVEQTNAVYAKYAPKTTTTPAADGGGAASSGGSSKPNDESDGTDDPGTDTPAPKKKPKSVTTTSTGGCNGH